MDWLSVEVTCNDCGYKHPRRYSYHRVSGWARPRDAGGTHAIRIRQASYAMWLCHGCMEQRVAQFERAEKMRRGIMAAPVVSDDEQFEMFGEPEEIDD
jgi:RNase P subunit RPR2